MSIKKSALYATATAATLALTLSACGGGTTTGSSSGGGHDPDATVNIGSLYEPQNLDNTAGGGQGVTEALNGNVYEGLFRLTDDGKVDKLLAEDHKVSPDGLTYTFTLRDKVTFHSGKKLTSQDVKYSLEKVIAKDSQSARKSNLEVIQSIATPDPRTVQVKLSKKSISFIYNLSYVWIINSEARELKTSEDGTGPYKLNKWTRGSALSLDRFSGYWGDAASNKQVVFRYFKDANALNNALLTNAVDVVTSEQSPDALDQFKNNQNYKVNEGNSTTKLLLAFNDKVKPFTDAKVRQAVSAAIDDKKLLESVWGGHGKLIGSMVPPTDPWYEDLTAIDTYDTERAKKLLGEAGYPKGFSFTLDTPNYDPHPTAATFITSQLAKVGITVKINTITPDEWYTKVYKNRGFEATLQEHVNDRDLVWYGNPDFYWGYNDPQVTQWVEQAEQSSTAAEQTELLKKVNRKTAEDAASDWLYLYPQIVVASSKLSGYPLNGLNSQFYAYDIKKG
ncbi:ABC transporter substrate-binding protein [Streptomyces albipurpureus]|uniref:ABC transporter substrate-binding protein n=1 Tax=Streptomyces albipurpureus TaxID=2897419 RepID=A0ABT0ULV9_9ACTN|nr:ABC transporter substrate-binding protein [Streptomyces sp. CWNU-1]MCM2389493.1 ABC transporter substrate-binding protein [Streptomyces sp. CWNU-1]